MTTLINLIGAQPMPNLIPVWQYRPERVVLIASGDTSRVASNLEALCHNRGIVVETKVVESAFDVRALRAEVSSHLGRHPEETWVNVTGGTKLMSLAAFVAAQREGSPVFYVDTGEGYCIRHLLPQVRQEPITVEFRVAEVLAAHGIVAEVGVPPASRLLPVARRLAEHAQRDERLLAELRQRYERPGNPSYKRRLRRSLAPDERGLLQLLVQQGMIRQLHIGETTQFEVVPDYWGFLGGGWLEAYVYERFRRVGFDDVQINVKIESGGMKNELDVVACQGVMLTIVSCKSGQSQKEHLSELKLLADLMGGIYCRKILVKLGILPKATDTNPRESLRRMRQSLLSRAQEYGVEVVFVEQLTHIGL